MRGNYMVDLGEIEATFGLTCTGRPATRSTLDIRDRETPGMSSSLIWQPAIAFLKRSSERMIPPFSFKRSVFILGHMRSGSTALSHVICHSPLVSGYGETQVRYDSPKSPRSVLIKQIRRRAWQPGARYLFDKILSNHLDENVPPGFFDAHAIFVVREPHGTILSIREMYKVTNQEEYSTDVEAADYYEGRLERLAALWQQFPQDRKIGLTFARLTADPDAALRAISSLLDLRPPLINRYENRGRINPIGVGDPLSAHKFSAIVPSSRSTSIGGAPRALDLPGARIQRLERLHQAMVDTMVASGACIA